MQIYIQYILYIFFFYMLASWLFSVARIPWFLVPQAFTHPSPSWYHTNIFYYTNISYLSTACVLLSPPPPKKTPIKCTFNNCALSRDIDHRQRNLNLLPNCLKGSLHNVAAELRCILCLLLEEHVELVAHWTELTTFWVCIAEPSFHCTGWLTIISKP